MSGNNTGKTLRGLIYILIIAACVAVFLDALNRLPSMIQKGFAKKYDSVEAAKRSLGFDDILAPRYFPEGVSWPPSFIFGQLKPYKAVVLEFRETGKAALIIIQSSRIGSESQLQRIRMSELKEDIPYSLKGRAARLKVGTCDNGMSCSEIAWSDKGNYCTVLFMSSPFELIRIAESMLQ